MNAPDSVMIYNINGVTLGEPVQVNVGDTVVLTKDNCVEVGKMVDGLCDHKVDLQPGSSYSFAVHVQSDPSAQLPHEDEEDTDYLDRKKRIMDAIRDYERDNR